jgi:hypothetical protein
MSNELTNNVNRMNIESIRSMIRRKQGWKPFLATLEDTTSVMTDMDHFPYTRFFRGRADSTCPIVFEREAGWRPLENACYEFNRPPCKTKPPKYCWESACSVVYPCVPE